MAFKVICGLDFHVGTDNEAAQRCSTENGFSFVSIPISHPKSKEGILLNKDHNRVEILFTKFNLVDSNQDWKYHTVCKLGDYYDVDSKDVLYRRMSINICEQEISYASYIGIKPIIVKLDTRPRPNLARILNDWILNQKPGHSIMVWIHIPMINPQSISNIHSPEKRSNDTWHWWNNFRLMCDSNSCLGIALEVTEDLPTDEELARWFGEPLKIVLLPTSIFVTNKKGYPILPAAHRTFVKKCASHNLKLLLTGSCRHTSIRHYLQYLNYVYCTATYAENLMPWTRGFEDSLHYPLQPLMDNLQSYTYEIFERDPVKYTEYGRAIYEALMDRVKENEKISKIQVVMIVGAGRGPLVNVALNSAIRANRTIRCYAVEKNPNALLTLLTLKNEIWRDKVEIVGCDMRDWIAPEKGDILVSELLGSFGDNELSPECLDGAQKYLKEGGISIPCKYTSYICPTQSSKLYNAATQNLPSQQPFAGYEMPHIVDPLSAYMLAKAQPLFSFDHPNKDAVIDNRRYKVLNFKAEQDSVLYGFIGYFDTILYKDIKLSIVPDTYSKGMFSWSPIFFPIKNPVQLEKFQDIEVHFWRLCDTMSVWYEWSIAKPVVVPIHNSNGSSYNIGLVRV